MTEIKKDNAAFEGDLERLEDIVAKLEEGGLSLEESIKLFEQGQQLLVNCKDKLEKARIKVQRLLENGERENIDPRRLGR